MLVTNTRLAAFIDVFIVITILVAVKQIVLPYSYLMAGPASTLSAMIVAHWLLRRRGSGWRELGFVWPVSWPQTALFTIVAFSGIVATAVVANLVTNQFFPDLKASGRFDFVTGNLLAYFGVMALVWTHGSFFEEMLFRAFLISRGSDILRGGIGASVVVVVVLSCFFGYRHYYYQGINGALVTGFIGLTLSMMYLWFGKKNLLPLIFAHGLVNTISQTQRFLSGGGD
jgi:membrane protease YdiL (CAAX protease family)